MFCTYGVFCYVMGGRGGTVVSVYSFCFFVFFMFCFSMIFCNKIFLYKKIQCFQDGFGWLAKAMRAKT